MACVGGLVAFVGVVVGLLVAPCAAERRRAATGMAGSGRSRMSLLSNAALVVVLLVVLVGSDSAESDDRCADEPSKGGANGCSWMVASSALTANGMGVAGATEDNKFGVDAAMACS